MWGVGTSSPDEMVEESLGDVGGKAFKHHRPGLLTGVAHQLAHTAYRETPATATVKARENSLLLIT
jgi:hypothetical protein